MPLGLNIGSGFLAPALVTPQAAAPQGSLAWVHLDRHERVHVTGDARTLPFRAESFDVVWCSHLIEHIPLRDVPAFLAEVGRLLAPNGYLYCAAPDTARARAAGSAQWETYGREGNAFNEGWEHLWACDADVLRMLIAEAGLTPWPRYYADPIRTHILFA